MTKLITLPRAWHMHPGVVLHCIVTEGKTMSPAQNTSTLPHRAEKQAACH